MMDEARFNALAEATMAKLESALESCADGFDYEVQPGGVLELEFDDGSKIIVNRHSAAREIWVAAKAGGFHFRYEDGRWVGTRDGVELFEALSRLISAQAAGAVRLSES